MGSSKIMAESLDDSVFNGIAREDSVQEVKTQAIQSNVNAYNAYLMTNQIYDNVKNLSGIQKTYAKYPKTEFITYKFNSTNATDVTVAEVHGSGNIGSLYFNAMYNSASETQNYITLKITLDERIYNLKVQHSSSDNSALSSIIKPLSQDFITLNGISYTTLRNQQAYHGVYVTQTLNSNAPNFFPVQLVDGEVVTVIDNYSSNSQSLGTHTLLNDFDGKFNFNNYCKIQIGASNVSTTTNGIQLMLIYE